ncbi:DEAD/DEAH box helicase [Dietzia maris]|uniref:DEAD/DEAH box helicase family protein n=1 Tax=Dietzia maris TaxID=37915 RepID=A0ABT8GXY9_9ACTN|nr:DEAD/DEAH box helicase family protein [Dietzia maris]MDN4505085.1 DEAD/DEAH box helicase family protein [Dietzia maris]
MAIQHWAEPDRALVGLVDDFHSRCVEVYRRDPNRVEEDAGKERGIAEGGYGRKQIQELIQNAADALQGSPGRIQVTLTDDTLYVANQGHPFVDTGVRALLYTHLSNKFGTEIGRFGLGFKSISGISDAPQILSRSVSFEFNRMQTARELSEELGRQFEPSEVPALRVAWPIDPQVEFRSDAILAELAQWAITIVRIPLLDGVAPELSREIAEFDESFTLFAPHVRQLDLRDDLAGEARTFKASKKGNRITLTTEDGEREWLVVSREHHPSPAALESAGHAARREAVTVSWAVPTTGKVRLGQLSAFFPVQSELTLSGRVNAPWKLSDDRINVIECKFNFEILTEVLPQLVVDARKDLIADGSFGRYIDVLPARGKEIRSWADKVINEPIYRALRTSRCLPDLDGQLRSPGSMQRVPDEVEDFSEQWIQFAGDRGAWIHPECTTNKERKSKVDRLMEQNGSRVGRTLDWLESVVSILDADHSAAAIEIAASLISKGGNVEKDVRDSRIVLLENGRIQQPVRGRCFIRSSLDQQGNSFVDPAVAERASTNAALVQLGITTFDDGGEMLELLSELARTGKADWDSLWSSMRGSGEEQVSEAFREILRDKATQIVRVRNGRGEWVLPNGLYLPGECLKPLKEDGAHLVDAQYHAADAELLALLGVHGRPVRERNNPREKWVSRYREAVIANVSPELGLGPQSREKLEIDSLDGVLGPLQMLPELSATNNAALTNAVLNGIRSPWSRISHPSVSRTLRYTSPEIWWVRQGGVLATTLGLVPVNQAFSATVEEGDLQGLLPAVTDLILSAETEKYLNLRTEINQVAPDEFERLATVHAERRDLERVGLTYAWWCEIHPEHPPAKLWVVLDEEWQERNREEVAVVTSMDQYRTLQAFSIPSILATGEDLYNLREFWGCLEGQDLPVTYTYETSAEPETLTDVFGVLDALDLEDEPEDLVLQKCLSISQVAAVPGQPEVRLSCRQAREDNRLLVTGSSDREILQQVLTCLNFDDSDEQVDVLLEDMERRRNSRRIREIKKAPTDDQRLLAFVGEERLRALIPKGALSYLKNDAYSAEPAGVELARLCVTMHGVRALERACKVDPQNLPIHPPSSWNGSFPARKWIAQLGFGEEWAGEKTKRRNKPTEYVDGPIQLGALHDYQQRVSDRLKQLLMGGDKRRGLISLPTGAGKTRVAVQTVIEAIRDGLLDPDSAESSFSGPILWLSDGEELCEQAIDAWSFLWRAVGRQDTQLVLSRFWANYEMEEEAGGVQVVVATWNKVLVRAVDNEEFAWLSEAPIVIIDEAHGALHKSYTRILAWLGRDSSRREKPLIGLSATPFRGRRDSDETKRLMRRFDENILDEGVFGDKMPQLKLQNDGVLAKPRLELIASNVSIRLTSEELDEFTKKYWLPKKVETSLGRNEDRTRIILDSILDKPTDWQIVVFAASVEAAQTLATLLTLAGRPAASIDQDTSPEDRRSAIERFKARELKVLTNYAVLSQGFDAPKTDAVYITRPTSSEVRYMQMVGRGLRGPANGGTSDVLIVNVLDNILEFGNSIVYQSLREIVDVEDGSQRIA